MITSIYQGGLGNLLFQISMGWVSSKQTQNEYYINVNNHKGFGQGHHISKYTDNVFKNIKTTAETPTNIIKEENLQNILDLQNKNFTLDGFFQKYFYIKSYKEELNKLFGFDTVKLKTKESVCSIQIRTGDYLHPHHSNFNIITPDYIKNCVNAVLIKEQKIKFYIITDDINLAKYYIPSNLNAMFLNLNEIDDLKLMSQSDYCIISNSTFGWWGSFLGKKKITYAPEKWFNDNENNEIYREDMERIKLN